MSTFLNNREQKIFIVCMVAIFSAVMVNSVIVPLNSKKLLLNEQIAIEQNELSGKYQIIQKAEALSARHKHYMSEFGKSGSPEEVAASILTEIETVASRYKLQVAELKPEKIIHQGIDHQFSVQLSMNSDFVDVMRFLYALQQTPYLFDIEEVNITKSMRRDQKGLTTNLVLGKSFILNERADKAENKGLSL